MLELIFGPMFSSKTSTLFSRIKRLRVAGKKCVCVKYEHDTRYSELSASTHDGEEMEAISCTSLSEISDQLSDFEVIGIDEGQFYPDLVRFVNDSIANVHIIISALDGDFQMQPFPNGVNSLISIADKCVKLNAVCSFKENGVICGNDAPFTRRISSEKNLEVIGGSDKYMAVCRKHH